MKPIRFPKCGMVNGDFYASNNVVINQDEAFHEHDFIPIAVKGLNSCRVIKCVTCGKLYFELSGKALTDEEINEIPIEEVK
jgi:hypothetical protein